MRHCTDEQLLSHLDGELGADTERDVSGHLLACWQCRRRLAAMEGGLHRLARLNDDVGAPGNGWQDVAGARLRAGMRRVEQEAAPRRMMPWYSTAAVAASMALVWVGFVAMAPSPLEARATLRQSMDQERAMARNSRGLHKTWKLEKRAQGKLVASRRVDHWQGNGARPEALRVYEGDQLTAAAWTSASGERTTYANPQFAAPDEFEMLTLSTSALLSRVGEDTAARIRKDGELLVVDFELAPGARVTQAQLVLREDGLRPTREVLTVGAVEYQLEETSYRQYWNEPPSAEVFAPLKTETRQAALVVVPNVVARVPVPARSAAADPAVEVKILLALAMENVTPGEQVQLKRRPNGVADLILTVGSETKRAQVEAAVAGLLAESGGELRITVQPGLQGATDAAGKLYTHAMALRETGDRFTNVELARLGSEELQQWRQLVFRQLQALHSETIHLEQQLGKRAVAMPGAATLRDVSAAAIELRKTDAQGVANLRARLEVLTLEFEPR